MRPEITFFNPTPELPEDRKVDIPEKKMGYADTVKTIRQEFPELTNIQPLNLRHETRVSEVARLNAVHTEHVSALALEGFDLPILKDSDRRPMWETDPTPPNFYDKYLAKTSLNGHRYWYPECAYRGDREKVFSMLEEIARSKEVAVKLGKNIDLKNLTPYEATYLIGTLISKKMHYDYIVGEYFDRAREMHDTNIPASGNEEILELQQTDKKKFEKVADKYIRKVDNMKTDEILEYGWGVCRHFAGIASFAYETLKDKQESIALNGTYLLSYSTSSEQYSHRSAIENHMFNVLVITSPRTDTSAEQMLITAIDPTKAAARSVKEFDTNVEASFAIPKVVAAFGKDLGIETAEQEAQQLADIMVERIERVVSTIPNVNFKRFWENYASLLEQSSDATNHEKILHKIYKMGATIYGDSRRKIFAKMVIMPVITEHTEEGGNRLMNAEYIEPIYRGIEQMDFSGIEDSFWLQSLLEGMESNLLAITGKDNENQVYKLLKRNSAYPAEIIVGNIVRVYNMGNREVPEDTAEAIRIVHAALGKLGKADVSQEDLDKFMSKVKQKEKKAYDPDDFFY